MKKISILSFILLISFCFNIFANELSNFDALEIIVTDSFGNIVNTDEAEIIINKDGVRKDLRNSEYTINVQAELSFKV